LLEEIRKNFKCHENGIFFSNGGGYWSSLNLGENSKLIESLTYRSPRQALRKLYPHLENVVFSPKRQAGLELLQLTGNETCIDFGCMWGALTIPLAKRTRFVLGVDQTLDSLRFLKARIRESQCQNVALLNHDIRQMPILSEKVDVAIVNGVLEWVPEQGRVELKGYFHKRLKREYKGSPGETQKTFLEKVYANIKDKGKLYLAIENRYALNTFFGERDPHTGLLFTSFSPRWLANSISQMVLGRKYVNWLYSFGEMRRILSEVGFSKIDLYMCFPDYRYPTRIIPYEASLRNFESSITTVNSKGKRTIKRWLARKMERIVFRYLGIRSVAPSIIAIAHK